MASNTFEEGKPEAAPAAEVNQTGAIDIKSPEPNAQPDKGGEAQPDKGATGKFAGKSAAEVQSSFEELEQRFGKQGNELSTLRQQVNELNGKLGAQVTPPDKGQGPAGKDVGFNLEESLAELQAEYEAGNLNTAQFQQKSVQLTREAANADTQQLLDQATQNIEQSVANRFAEKELGEKRAQFLKDNADFAELQKAGKLAEMVRNDPFGFHDEFSAYYAVKAEQARQEGIEEGKKIKAGAESGPPVVDTNGPPEEGGGDVLSSMIAAALDAGS